MTICRRGSTLIEVVIALVILGICAAIATPAIGRALLHGVPSTLDIVAESSTVAVSQRRAITFKISDGSGPHVVSLGRDGSVIADSSLRIDLTTGVPFNAR